MEDEKTLRKWIYGDGKRLRVGLRHRKRSRLFAVVSGGILAVIATVFLLVGDEPMAEPFRGGIGPSGDTQGRWVVVQGLRANSALFATTDTLGR